MKSYDVVIVGGGMIGATIAYGLSKSGKKILILDKGDLDFRAARGNFGLVWVQSKGADFSPYAQWTRASSEAWSDFSQELSEISDVDIGYERRGGISFCLSEQGLADCAVNLAKLSQNSNTSFEYSMLSAGELKKMVPEVGPTIPGASYTPHDGHVNPLYLLRALYKGFIRNGGEYQSEQAVQRITAQDQGFRVSTIDQDICCEKIVLTAGLDNQRLAEMLDMQQPVRPQRGQILVTERIAQRVLDYPTNYLRQTMEGSVQIGDSKEEVGFNDSTSAEVIVGLAQQAQRILPCLGQQSIVRAWGALRVLTPDGYPVYEQSKTYPGAFAVTSHSGVTLAAIHANALANDILAGSLKGLSAAFGNERFQGVTHV